MDGDLDYEKKNIEYAKQHSDGGIKCKNFAICGSILPEWWFECKGHYICTNCDMMFGKELNFIENIECLICFENETCVSQPKCIHTMCIKCFKRCYFGDDDAKNEPNFPYDKNIEDDYFENMNEPKYENDELIKYWNMKHNEWEDNKNEKYEDEENLHCCPICRK